MFVFLSNPNGGHWNGQILRRPKVSLNNKKWYQKIKESKLKLFFQENPKYSSKTSFLSRVSGLALRGRVRRFIFHEGLTIVTSSPQRCQLGWFSNLTRLPPGCLLAELSWACPPDGNFGANSRKPEEIMSLIWLGKTSISPRWALEDGWGWSGGWELCLNFSLLTQTWISGRKWMEGLFLGRWGGTNQENRMSEKRYQETKAGNTDWH